MNIRLSGYELHRWHPKFGAAALSKAWLAGNDTSMSFQGRTQYLRAAKIGRFTAGWIGTDKGHRRYPQLEKATRRMSSGSVPPGFSMSSFVFFLLCPNGRGLMSHYGESGGLPFYFGISRTLAGEALRESLTLELQALGGGSTKEKGKIRKVYSGEPFATSELVSDKDYAEVIAKWNDIRAMEVTYARIADDDNYRKIRALIATKKEKVTFIRERGILKSASVAALAKAVVPTVRKLLGLGEGVRSTHDASRVRIIGVNEFNAEVGIDVRHIPSWFGERDFDGMLNDRTTFGPLPESSAVKWLIEEANKYPDLFGG
jgi:hypothetical protein